MIAIKINEPANPCKEYKDLLVPPFDRIPDGVEIDVLKELDRAECLVNWIKRYQSVPVWR